YSGTSMATPAVSGVVALMLSENPALTASEIRSQLLNSGRKMESLKSKVVTEAQMNVSNMLSSFSGAPDEMESPEAGSYLSGSSETFYWTKGRFVTDFKLKIGSTAGASDVYESDSLGTVTSKTVDNLPVDDRDFYVTLSSQTDDEWQNRPYQYASWGPNAKASAAELEKPVEDTVLNEGETYEFSWTTGSGLDQKWLKVGSEPNQGDYVDEQVDGSTKKDLTFDLFTSEKAYVTLESQDPYGQWTKKGYAFDVTLSQQSRITSPSPESTVGPGETEFSWRKGDKVLGHWLTVKDARGPTTYFDGPVLPGEDSKSVDIPATGRRIKATLSSIILNPEEITPEAIQAGKWKKDHIVYYLSPKPE
ncbi:MAG: S8 family serine peptidase, partial [Pseudomonadales bacterium]|nr:S8 family serine peptidase [Pseudomonadales bacterium]